MILRVKPRWRNHGASLGLQYPIIYGSITGFGFGCWNRHTGEILYISKKDRFIDRMGILLNLVHGYGNDSFSSFLYDIEP